MQNLEPLRTDLDIHTGHAGQIAAGLVEAADQPGLDRIGRDREDNRNRRGRRLGCQRRLRAAARHDYGHLALHEFGGEGRQLVSVSIRPSIFDRHVLAFDQASLLQAAAKGSKADGINLGRSVAEEPDDRQRTLLRTRGK